ncbi:MAG TPA: WG repeat-containing protein, partial [Flexilinea sp.]|nr:WG repeat-containing protein [Flexilinea sp.]
GHWLLVFSLVLLIAAVGFLLNGRRSAMPEPLSGTDPVTERTRNKTPVPPVMQTQLAFATYQENSRRQVTKTIIARQLLGQTATVQQALDHTATALDATMNAWYRNETAALWTPTPTPTMTRTLTQLEIQYSRASAFFEQKKWADAEEAFSALGSFQDAPQKAAEAMMYFYLETQQYAKLNRYVLSISDNEMKDNLKQKIYDNLYNGEEKLFPIKGCNGKEGYFNLFNDQIIEPQYDYAGDFSEGLAKVEQNWKWGFINTAGEPVIPIQFDDVRSFYEGLAVVKQEGKYGFVNTSGQIVIEPQYDLAGFFFNGLADVIKNGKEFYIDPTGETVITGCDQE